MGESTINALARMCIEVQSAHKDCTDFEAKPSVESFRRVAIVFSKAASNKDVEIVEKFLSEREGPRPVRAA